MSLPNSLLAYADCLEVLDKAVEDSTGIRVGFKTRDEATVFRMRIHQARKLQRQENALAYEVGDKMYGKSPYDAIKVTLRSLKSGHYVYFEHRIIHESMVESLAGVEDEPEVFVPPARQDMSQVVTQSLADFKRRV